MILRLQARLRALRGASFWKALGTPAGRLRIVTLLILVAALEVFARMSPNDWFDGIGVIAVGGLAATVWTRHRRALRRFWRIELRPWRERLEGRWFVRAGLDIRGGPPLPFRLPVRYAAVVGVLALLVAALTIWRGAFPAVFRDELRSISGFAYLVYLSLLWGTLLGGTILATVGAMGFTEVVTSWFEWTRRRPQSAPTLAWTLLGLDLVLTLTAPPRFAAIVIFVAFVLHASLVTYMAGKVNVIWQYRGEQGRLAWGRWSMWGVLFGAAISLALIALILLATGNHDTLELATPATVLIGRAFAWTAALVFPLIILASAFHHVTARLNDPARPVPPQVGITWDTGDSAQRDAQKPLTAAGFQLVKDGYTDVELVVGERADHRDLFQAARWPLDVGTEELDDPVLHERIVRRVRLMRRRLFLRRLKGIFKHAARRKYERGTGFWVCPHLWYSTHLSRDTDEEHLVGTIAPAYHHAIPRAARHHFYCVMRDLELDLIFVEDGVGFRRFQRVLRALFEYHDLFGARRMEDERTFSGLPGVRVVIHFFDLESPFENKGYPEPDYEEIGRARILHVFRDRGGDEEEALTPDDYEFLPTPHLPDLVLT